jgi:hypothetical protein
VIDLPAGLNDKHVSEVLAGQVYGRLYRAAEPALLVIDDETLGLLRS